MNLSEKLPAVAGVNLLCYDLLMEKIIIDTRANGSNRISTTHGSLVEKFWQKRYLFREGESSIIFYVPEVIANLPSTPVETSYEVGQKVSFRVRLNPTATRQGSTTLLPRDEWLDFSWRKIESCGLDIKSLTIFKEHERKFKSRNKSLWFKYLDVEGTGVVVNPELLKHAIIGGVGKAKAFGAGLLEVV